MAEIALAGATAALRQTVGVLGNLVLKEGSRLSRLREDIVWIEREMRHIQAYLEDAEARQGGSRGVANLVIDIRDLACDVEDIMQKYFPRIASHIGKKFLGCLKSATCIVCYGYDARNFAVEIEGIKRRVEDINRVRQTYGINESSGSRGRDMWDERRSFPHIDEPNVVGFEEHIKDLVAKLLNKELQCCVISIIGMAGLGKTTLAKKVFKSAQHNFERSAWIYVSQQPNIRELLLDIARQVGLEKGKEKEKEKEKEKWEKNIEVNLFTFLSEHRYVIVLDDMWHIETWDAIKNAIPTNTRNGSRIILTSRNNYVGTHVGGRSSLHELQPLNEENSRKLFFRMVMVEASDPPQLENIGEQILKRCSGVPLAIVLAAGLLLLKERSENAWKGILEGMGQDEDQCSKIFGLSYKDLPTNLKPCFLYFGLFPEDHEISAFELVNLWAAEGFIQGSGVREVEDVGDDYLNHLIVRNLIQVVQRRFDGKVRSCRIHDILHDLCIREAKEINFFNTQNDVITTGVRRVTTHGSNFGDYISLNYRTPKLRSMLSFSGNARFVQRKMVKNFLRDFEFLRVLSVKCDSLPRALPKEVGNLKNLYYLGLGYTGLLFPSCIEIPHTISNLKGLLTFDVRDINFVGLPDVLWTMKQLRHVLLPYNWYVPSFCGINLDRIFYRTEICLPNVQTLYGLTEDTGCDFSFLHKLINLRKFGVYYWSNRIPEILSDPTLVLAKLEKLILVTRLELLTCNLSRYGNLLSLKLGDRGWQKLPQHDELPPNLTKLTLAHNYLKEDPMETLKKLPKLKILKLYSHSYVGSKMVCPGAPGCNFPQLEVLKIDLLVTLEELIVEEGGMPRLKELGIFGCNPITTVPDRIKNTMEIHKDKTLMRRFN